MNLDGNSEVKMWEVWAITAATVGISAFLLFGNIFHALTGVFAVAIAGIATELIP